MSSPAYQIVSGTAAHPVAPGGQAAIIADFTLFASYFFPYSTAEPVKNMVAASLRLINLPFVVSISSTCS